MFLLGTLFLQGGLGLEPVFAGMVTIGFAVASACSSWIGGNLVTRLGRPLVVGGILGMIATAGALAVVALMTPAEWTPWAMAAVMVAGGFAGGLVISPNQTLTLADIPVSRGQLGQRIGTAVGTAIALALFYATVYREQGDRDPLVVYHDAYAMGMIAVGVFLGLALIVGVADLAGRARNGSQTP
jgi:MFS family permease